MKINMEEINLYRYKGQMFKHFKGDLYLLMDIVSDSETESCLVIYKALYGCCKIWARPYEMFLSKVDKVKYPNILQEYRFEPITISSVRDDPRLLAF